MLHTTRAITLRTFKHGDRTMVLKAYTEAFGARSYIVRTGTKDHRPSALLQPLSRLELVVTEAREKDLHVVRELRADRPYVNVPRDHARGLLLLFAQEVLYRTLREESPDAALFAFTQGILERIDTDADTAHAPFHLLCGLMRHLGFAPEVPADAPVGFDMREGHFLRSAQLPHEHCLDEVHSQALVSLLRTEEGGSEASLAASLRRTLLEHLLTYFRLHVAGFGELRSPEVLHAVLH